MPGEIGNFYVALGLVAKEFQKGLQDAKKNINQFSQDAQSSVGGVTAAWKTLGETLQRYSAQFAIMGGAIVGSLGLLIRQSVKAGEEIAVLARKTGIAAEEISRLGYAAGQENVSMERLAMGIKMLYTRMDEARQGLKTSQEAFERLGVSVTDSYGRLRSGIEVFMDLADRLSQVTSEAERSALAAEIFGQRVGPDLLPLLNRGREGIRQLIEEADRLGITMSTEMAEKMKKFSDSMFMLKETLAAAGREIAIPLVEALIPLAKRLAEAASGFRKWAEENQALVGILLKLVGGGGVLLILTSAVSKLIPLITALVNGFRALAGAMSMSATALGAITGGAAALAVAFSYIYGRIDKTRRKTEELIASLKTIDPSNIDQVTESLKALDEQIQVLERMRDRAKETKTALNILGGVLGPLGTLVSELFKKRMFTGLDEDINKLREAKQELEDMKVTVEDINDPGVVLITPESLAEQIKYLKTLVEFGRISQEEYLKALQQLSQHGGLSAESEREIADEILNVQKQMYQEAYDQAREAHQKLIELEKQKQLLATQTAQKMAEAYKRYRDAVISYAQQLRVQEELILTTEKPRTYEEAEALINQILEQKAQEREQIIRGQHEAILEIEQEYAERRIEIQESVQERLLALEEQYQAKKKDLQAKVETTTQTMREKIYEYLGPYIRISKLVAMSDEELIKTYREVYQKLSSGGGVIPEAWARQEYEEWKRNRERARIDQAREIEEFIKQHEKAAQELQKIDKEYQEERKRIEEEANADLENLAQNTKARISELSEYLLKNIDTTIAMIKERLEEMQNDFTQNQKEIIQSATQQWSELSQQYDTALADFQTFTQQYSAIADEALSDIDFSQVFPDSLVLNLRGGASAMMNFADSYSKFAQQVKEFPVASSEIFPDEVAQNISQAGEGLKEIGTELGKMPDVFASAKDHVDLMKQHFASLGESVEGTARAVRSLASAINSLQDKTVTVTVRYVHVGEKP